MIIDLQGWKACFGRAEIEPAQNIGTTDHRAALLPLELVKLAFAGRKNRLVGSIINSRDFTFFFGSNEDQVTQRGAELEQMRPIGNSRHFMDTS